MIMTKQCIPFFFCSLTFLSTNLPVSAALKRFTSHSTTNLPAALTHVPAALAALKRSRSVTVPPAIPEPTQKKALPTPSTPQPSTELPQVRTWTPLHDACWKGDTERVQRLIAEGADVNARDLNGDAPLHFAAGNNRLENIVALKEAGAIVNVTTRTGSTPLFVAILHGQLANVQELLSMGANTKNIAHSGFCENHTPLSLAKQKQYYLIIRLLIDVEQSGSSAATRILKTKNDYCWYCQAPFKHNSWCISLCTQHDFCKKCITLFREKQPQTECRECTESLNSENLNSEKLLIRIVTNK